MYIFIGVTTIPHEGDSLNYHIPFAKAYLNGTIINPAHFDGEPLLEYFPGASESILSLFILLSIPLNLYNVLGVIILVISCYYLGKNSGLNSPLSLIFAICIGTLHGVVRWVDVQTIDIWLASWFVLSVLLLRNPQKKVLYFLMLGFTLGMLIGSKYSGLLFGIVLGIYYFRKIINYISFKRFIAFLLPFGICGLSWYIRNYLLTGNPLFPQDFLFFQGAHFQILKYTVWKMVFLNPSDSYQTLNAFISEYMIWVFVLPISIFYFLKSFFKMKFFKDANSINEYLIIGLLNVIIFFFLPSGTDFNIKLSIFRYSFPAFIPLILSTFLIAVHYKKEKIVALTAFANMYFVGFPTIFVPKLLFVYIPIVLFIFSDYCNWQFIKSRLRVLRVVIKNKLVL